MSQFPQSTSTDPAATASTSSTPPPTRNVGKRLTRDQRRDILLMRRLGYSYERIANFLGVTQRAVQYTCQKQSAEPQHSNSGRKPKSENTTGYTNEQQQEQQDLQEQTQQQDEQQYEQQYQQHYQQQYQQHYQQQYYDPQQQVQPEYAAQNEGFDEQRNY